MAALRNTQDPDPRPDSVRPGIIDLRQQLDGITAEQLRALGSVKWSTGAQPDGTDTIGAFIAEMDFGAAPEITQALHRSVDDALFGYLPQRLSDQLAQACADWQRESYGWRPQPDRVKLIPDVLKGLELAILHYSRPGSPVIMPVPAYMPFLILPELLGREIIRVPLINDEDGYRLDPDGLAAAYAAGGDLLVLCNPYNPVGRVFDRDELTAISAVVDANGGRVFADEIHAPLVYRGRSHLPYASISEVTAGHTITATSASKAWNLPGLKCAQLIISNDADRQTWDSLGPFVSHGVSNPGVIANTVAYTEGRPWLDGVIDYLDGNRRLLSELLDQELPMIGYTPPEGTYIGWLDCRELDLGGRSAAAFFAEHAGVALTDGADCGTPGFARMVFATPRPILTDAVRRMGRAVRQTT
ncbi:MalY/PatB family protein [Microlunatus soli]|uniref:cysteine-S-conjugate beta-lyase n=1 Tax=Microlunatus soli TaxID=630515 RepID=A0A1H1VN64_9ACTN|nr:aminotransferase class I/II-fold pyridoxal phosphate-dependent enzyme [Microlunatus soli]SDS85930.1 cystathione beta-lyase [Microlunatus soli]